MQDVQTFKFCSTLKTFSFSTNWLVVQWGWRSKAVWAAETQATWLKYITNVSRAQRHRGPLFQTSIAGGVGEGGVRNSETGGLSGARPPQRQPTACADTVRAAQESSVTAETACAQVNVHKDGVRVCPHTHTHVQKCPDLGSEPRQSSPGRDLGGGILGKCKPFLTFWSAKCSQVSVGRGTLVNTVSDSYLYHLTSHRDVHLMSPELYTRRSFTQTVCLCTSPTWWFLEARFPRGIIKRGGGETLPVTRRRRRRCISKVMVLEP